MSPAIAPAAPVIGESAPTIPIQGVVLSEAEYRKLLAERQQLAELRDRVGELEEKYQVMRECYHNMHRAYAELIGDQALSADPNFSPPSLAASMSIEGLVKEADVKGRSTSK